MKKVIKFLMYNYTSTEGQSPIVLCYEDGQWDEHKHTVEEAVDMYPPSIYEWVMLED